MINTALVIAALSVLAGIAAGVTKAVDLLKSTIDPGNKLPNVLWDVAAFVFGIGAALLIPVHGLAMAGLTNLSGVKVSPVADSIVTGILLGGGSGFIHELLDLMGATTGSKRADKRMSDHLLATPVTLPDGQPVPPPPFSPRMIQVPPKP